MKHYLSYEKNPEYALLPVEERIELQATVVRPGDHYERLFPQWWRTRRRVVIGEEIGQGSAVSIAASKVAKARENAIAVPDGTVHLYRRLIVATHLAHWKFVPAAERDALEREVNDLTDALRGIDSSVSALKRIEEDEGDEGVFRVRDRGLAMAAAFRATGVREQRVFDFLVTLSDTDQPVPVWRPSASSDDVALLDEGLARVERSVSTHQARRELDEGTRRREITS